MDASPQGGQNGMPASQERAQFLGFGVFEVDRKARELRKQGRRIRLQDQPFLVLSMLLDRAGTVVTREELRAELWPGSVYVDFDHGLNNAIARLREALGDNATSPQYIETLPRLGYRFIYPVREQQPSPTAPPAPQTPETKVPPQPSATRPHTLRWGLATVIGAAAVVAMLLVGLWPGQRPAPTRPAADTTSVAPSIAVLPLVSLSSDIEDEYFADGLSEELLNQLARIRGLRVAGRASSFHFKGKSEPPAEIGRILQVEHLLQGNVRRSGDRVRITAMLIDARSGNHLWSETFERAFEDIFAIEDEIALSVASALQVQLAASDARQLRRSGTQDAEAYRFYLMGIAELRGHRGQQSVEDARSLFEQAIARDPGFAAAHAGLASYHFQGAAVSYLSPEEGARLGRTAAERAIALDPDGSEALRVMADFEMWRYRFLGDSAAYQRADALFRRATEVDPSNAFAHFDHGRAIQWCEPKRALRLFERSAELDPLATAGIGLAALAMSRIGMHEEAGLRLKQLVARSGEARNAHIIASFESYLGRLDHAATALQLPSPLSPRLVPRLLLWGVLVSLGDPATAAGVLHEAGNDPLTDALRTAALLGSEGRHAEAFEQLDRRRKEFPVSRVLDLPAARFALIAGQHERARALLEQRLPDVTNGGEPITAPRVLPALDLVLAWSQTGRSAEAERLLDRIEAFLDGPEAPRLPMFTVQRARAHALAGEADLARQALERAYTEGFRLTCALDLYPQPLLYVDCMDADPAFAEVRRSGEFDEWLARIRADNRLQLEQLRSRPADRAASRPD